MRTLVLQPVSLALVRRYVEGVFVYAFKKVVCVTAANASPNHT